MGWNPASDKPANYFGHMNYIILMVPASPSRRLNEAARGLSNQDVGLRDRRASDQ
jgi:hypothetical protein